VIKKTNKRSENEEKSKQDVIEEEKERN